MGKLAIAVILSASGIAQAWVTPGAARSSTALNAGVYYSTSTGNTETIAGYIAEAAGCGDAEEIGDASDDAITGADYLIVGAPTWHTDAEEQRSGTTWDEWLYETLPNLDLDERRLPSLDAETKNHMLITTVMPPVNFMINSRLREPLFMVRPRPMDTTMLDPRLKLMASLLDLCATKTTNMTNPNHVPRPGSNNLREKDSSKCLANDKTRRTQSAETNARRIYSISKIRLNISWEGM